MRKLVIIPSSLLFAIGAMIFLGALTGPAAYFGRDGTLGIVIIGIGLAIAYFFRQKEPHPICKSCGYVALDQRELHNHQINCEKFQNQQKSENS